jgi:hypothetical protein
MMDKGDGMAVVGKMEVQNNTLAFTIGVIGIPKKCHYFNDHQQKYG